MSEYVITEEQLKEHTKLCVSYGATDNVRTVGDLSMKLDEMDKTIRSRPLSSAIAEHNEAVIQELKTSIKSWNENLQPSEDYECGIIAGMEVAISLLKGVKEWH